MDSAKLFFLWEKQVFCHNFFFENCTDVEMFFLKIFETVKMSFLVNFFENGNWIFLSLFFENRETFFFEMVKMDFLENSF